MYCFYKNDVLAFIIILFNYLSLSQAQKKKKQAETILFLTWFWIFRSMGTWAYFVPVILFIYHQSYHICVTFNMKYVFYYEYFLYIEYLTF